MLKSKANLELNQATVSKFKTPRFRQFFCFYFEFSLTKRDIFPAMIGCCDCFGSGFTTVNSKALF